MTADSSWLQFRELRFRVSQLAGYRTEFTQRWDIARLVIFIAGFTEPARVEATEVEVSEWARRLDRVVKEGSG